MNNEAWRGEPTQEIVLKGGPFDGTALRAPLDMVLPSEITLRQAWCRPFFDGIYSIDRGVGSMTFTAESFENPSTTYYHVGQSEALLLIRSMAREAAIRNAEIVTLRKRLEDIGRRVARSIAAKKAVKTRKARKTSSGTSTSATDPPLR